MSIAIHSKNLALSTDQKEYIQKKAGKILTYSERASDESSKITIDINSEATREKDQHIHCNVNVFIPQSILHAESYAATVEAAIDECEDKLRRQVKKYKEKMQR